MIRYEYGNPDSKNVLIQMVDDHDLSVIENEVARIKEAAGEDFYLIAFKVDDWNLDLSPWQAPAVFGKEDFGGGAAETLKKVLNEIKNIFGTDIIKNAEGIDDPGYSLSLENSDRNIYIGGYSLAGLFALWAGYQTDIFAGIAAASPSVWFPGFMDYMTTQELRTDKVYLSLGDREEKTKNQVMATVGDCIRQAEEHLTATGTTCTLEWNQGNHFKDADIRTAKAFAWVLKPDN